MLVKKVPLLVLLLVLLSGAVRAMDCCPPAPWSKAKAPCARVVAPESMLVRPVAPDMICSRPVAPELRPHRPVAPEMRCSRPVAPESVLQRPVCPEMTCHVAPVAPQILTQRPVFPDELCVTVVGSDKGIPVTCPIPRGRYR